MRVCGEFAGAAGVDPAAFLAAVGAEKAWYWADPERHRVGRLDLLAARTAIVHGALGRLGREAPTVAAEAARAYALCRRTACRPFPGAIEALSAFRERGIRLALLTNGASDVQRDKIERFALARHFDGIFVEGELGFGKPDERVFHLALAAVGVAPRDAWVVGDNLAWEIVPAKRLGCGAVWVDPQGRGLEAVGASPEARPDRIVRAIRDLLA